MEPFTVEIDEEALADLRDRLRRTRWSRTVPGTGWSRGVPVDVLRDLVGHWLTGYDWQRLRRRLGEVPHLVTTVDGQRIHLVHARSPEPAALPLLLTHGWPGSVLDHLHLVGPLTDPARHGGDPADAFHVVAPSLPGFGFSTPLAGPGWDHHRIARAWPELMTRLGYARFGVVGGDTGSVVSPLVGRIAPDRVVGVHLHGNLDVPRHAPDESPAESARVDAGRQRARTDGGYAALQQTRPHTLGHALADSPAGQLAWVLDKLHDWTDPAHPPFGGVDLDDVLDLVVLFWVTGTAATSANLYYENRVAAPPPGAPGVVPTAVALFPTDPPTRSAAGRQHHLVRWTELPRGGHFAALEAPDLLVDDLRAFYRPLRDERVSRR
ncbi:microsomal epoxide hydrolase [Cellulomonas chitinilytica]|uniref:Microsomal epoxide hydrolase n=1 Tax=Cellulomonas chitinilytica TaxID=398759 RepID=A0A919TZP6_9CELL|nr:epoxide hydrolase family protein [Cellulomonas chitinilytica]GIG21995.1 microsomal epoxide hydrolase [Cellulomonas chitinilytica]